MVSAHPTRVVMVIGFVLAVFSTIGVASDGETSRKCQRVAGKWDMTYSGTSCQGEPEKGHFVLVIEPDCSFELKKENTIPFLSTLSAPGGKVRLKGNRIEASVHMPFDACERITFNGTIHESGDGQRITGTYRYRSEGNGRFTGAKEDRNDGRGQLGGPNFFEPPIKTTASPAGILIGFNYIMRLLGAAGTPKSAMMPGYRQPTQ